MKRLLLHIPVGVACAALVLAHWSLALVLTIAFLTYELNQDRHKKDRAFKDIAGFAWGIALAGIALLVLRALN
ncbi:MAG: hypothetical protein IBX68_12755 [Dehalococcoidia bacterium]|nr:hypothetical protein [Dehalococcoidia bacterium]